uniref:Uncharacterized protein n=1 Tax=Anguilla anguilla TaxID=7936 RepID=A0A0E9QW81_ANGAN
MMTDSVCRLGDDSFCRLIGRLLFHSRVVCYLNRN